MEINKPSDLSSIWAISGDRTRPSEQKVQMGWVVEIPTHQHENWIQNRQDTALAHINQHGIAVWDNQTQYVGGKSYVSGEDGRIYKAIVDNINSNPVLDSGSWRIAFLSSDDPVAAKFINGYVIISSDLDVSINSRYYALNSLTITLPLGKSPGDTVTVNKVTGAEVTFIVVDEGEIVTGAGLMEEVIYDIYDEINVVWNGTNWETS